MLKKTILPVIKNILSRFSSRSQYQKGAVNFRLGKEQTRNYSSNLKSELLAISCAGDKPNTGLVLGVYLDKSDTHSKTFQLTPSADKFNKYVDGKLGEQLQLSGTTPHENEVRIFYGVDAKFPKIALVGLGDECLSYNEVEQLDENKERIRQAAAAGSTALQKVCNVENVYVESFGHAESAAEGATMGLWKYQEHKKVEKRIVIPHVYLFDDCDFTGWHIGLHKAAAQNLARQLCDAPPNLLTPRTFSEHTVKLLNGSGINIEMKIKKWLSMVGMDSLLAIGRGSCEDPVLIEATYYGCDPDICPVVLIGKAVTFDSGGLCLKTPESMEHMRTDMAGAACVIAAIRAASALQLPINIRALIPMCENMIGPRALKPGDTIKSLKGNTVRLTSSDLDGRMSVADILTYAATFNPKIVLDIGTFNKNMVDSLGFSATGVWTNNDMLWEQMRVASVHTGDRVWRMPLWQHFSKRVKTSYMSDVKDVATDLGGPDISAALLQQFLCGGDWIHMDIYGVTRTQGETFPYLRKGMTGRPTRTLIEFLAQFACSPTMNQHSKNNASQKNSLEKTKSKGLIKSEDAKQYNKK